MSNDSFIALVSNVSLLVAMVFVYDMVNARPFNLNTRLRQIMIGLGLGVIAIAAGRITDITVVSPVYGDVSELAARVIKTQSLDVDGISGATVSTKAVLKAIDNALAARA
jgi:hypothetical protein